jgi:N-acetylglucosamine kinase-like BadF-type ATPase
MKALQMVNYAWIKRTQPTVLTKIFLNATGAKNEMDLMEGLSSEQYHLFPYIAVEVIKAAQDGDSAAQEVIHEAGKELGWLAVSVARQIEMENKEVEIVQSGSIFDAGELIANPMREVVMSHLPKAKLIRLAGPPVIGAVILGMEQARFDGYAVRENMVRTANKIIDRELAFE